MLTQGQLRLYFPAAVEQCQPFRAQHPFMAIGDHKIGHAGAGVKGQGAQDLDGIHTEQDAPLTAGLANGGHVHQQTAAVLHRRQGHQPGGGG